MATTPNPRNPQPSELELTTTFLKQGLPARGGTVPMLVRLEGIVPDAQTARVPLDVMLVIDRSGSMAKARMEAAIEGAHDAIDLLEVGDRMGIVTFDDKIQVLVPLTLLGADRSALHEAVDQIVVGNQTALHAGWLEAVNQLVDQLEPTRMARILLLTDGHANVGETNPTLIADDASAMRVTGITTSTIGIGGGFREDLLAAMAESGGGRFAYAEGVGDIQPILTAELVGLDAIAARQVRLSGKFTGAGAHTGVTLAEVLNDVPVEANALVLPDLVAEQPYEVIARLHVEPHSAEEQVKIGELNLSWLDREGKPQRRTIPVHADVLEDEAYDAVEANQDLAAGEAALRAARHRQVALAALDQGDEATLRSELRTIETILEAAPRTAATERERKAAERIRMAVEARELGRARKLMRFEEERRRTGFRFEEFRGSKYYASKEKALAEMRRRKAKAAAAAVPVPEVDPLASKPIFEKVVRQQNGLESRIRLLMGDITLAQVDAIVNPTNSGLHGTGRTVDGAVHRRGGLALTRECRSIGRVPVGESVVTRGHGLRANYVIHTVSPKSEVDPERGKRLLVACYETSLRLASTMHLKHVAFPAIGAGSNGFHPDVAAGYGLMTIMRVLANQDIPAPERVDIVVFDERMRDAYVSAADRIEKRMESRSVAAS